MDRHRETHRFGHIGWLRAAVLGANDGIVSTASLIVGIAATQAGKSEVLVSGVAALVAGAMAMAAGEYVSVSSQADTERADLAKERFELASVPERELAELAAIYVARGVEPGLAAEVARQLTANDALGAHARDELGHAEATAARPAVASLASAGSFAAGAALPILVVVLLPASGLMVGVSLSSLVFLAGLGSLAAYAGGASVSRAALRIVGWGASAMAVTALVGRLVGAPLS
ncbi:VIT family protein [Curvibacter fontanus]|jgi:VIT1/CCC1 family predicted Fe2+/Mn2+ transporter